MVRNGTVVDGTGAGPRPDWALVLRDGRIDWTGPAAEVPEISEPHRVVDAVGGTILPGFVDTHVHMNMSG